MKKLSTYLFLLLFSFQTSSWADDVRDFQIEGMSIGDSLLDYFSEKEIQENLPYEIWKGKKFDAFEFVSAERFKDYDAVQIGFKPVDKKYIIYSVEGMMSFDKDFPNCLNKMEEIKLEIEELKNLKKEEFDFRKHRQDKTGKSKYITTSYNFLNDDSINIQCYSWSEEMNQIDHLRISLRSKEYSEWIINEAY